MSVQPKNLSEEQGGPENAPEKITDNLFATFDPDEEQQWLVGGSCFTGNASASNGHYDIGADFDWGN